MDQPLTVVLPVYNCERQIRSSLLDILDLVPTLSRPLEVVVVDDGSTDETYETVCELARVYPQIRVLRQPVRQGLRAAMDMVRNRLNVEQVVLHDGISAISSAQLQQVLQAGLAGQESAAPQSASSMDSHGSRRFSSVRALHNRMEQAHRSVTAFQWVQLEKPLIPRRSPVARQPVAQGEVLAPVAPVYLANVPMGSNPLPMG